jgi:hypothetical protein
LKGVELTNFLQKRSPALFRQRLDARRNENDAADESAAEVVVESANPIGGRRTRFGHEGLLIVGEKENRGPDRLAKKKRATVRPPFSQGDFRTISATLPTRLRAYSSSVDEGFSAHADGVFRKSALSKCSPLASRARAPADCVRLAPFHSHVKW